MEFTGQAFEEMQEQNVRLLQQLREKDDANLKLMSEVWTENPGNSFWNLKPVIKTILATLLSESSCQGKLKNRDEVWRLFNWAETVLLLSVFTHGKDGNEMHFETFSHNF